MVHPKFKNIDKPKKVVSKNKFRHKWIDLGKEKGCGENYTYRCEKCGILRDKITFFQFSYSDKNGNFISDNAPDCLF